MNRILFVKNCQILNELNFSDSVLPFRSKVSQPKFNKINEQLNQEVVVFKQQKITPYSCDLSFLSNKGSFCNGFCNGSSPLLSTYPTRRRTLPAEYICDLISGTQSLKLITETQPVLFAGQRFAQYQRCEGISEPSTFRRRPPQRNACCVAYRSILITQDQNMWWLILTLRLLFHQVCQNSNVSSATKRWLV